MRAWLTPPTIPANYTCRALYYPDSVDFQAIVQGALMLLTDAKNWEAFDGGNIDDCVAAFEFSFEKFISGVRCMHIGAIYFWAVSTLPYGALVCDGSLKNIEDYPDLFGVLGYAYGGSGETFGLPNLGARVVVGSVPGGTSLGSAGGGSQVTLTESQMPAHEHSVSFQTALVEPGPLPINVIAPGSNWGTTTTGGGQPHNNIQPYIALRPLIQAL